MNEQMEEIEKNINKSYEKNTCNKCGFSPALFRKNCLQARKSQLQTDMKIVEELKEKLKEEATINAECNHKEECIDINEIDKLFEESVGR